MKHAIYNDTSLLCCMDGEHAFNAATSFLQYAEEHATWLRIMEFCFCVNWTPPGWSVSALQWVGCAWGEGVLIKLVLLWIIYFRNLLYYCPVNTYRCHKGDKNTLPFSAFVRIRKDRYLTREAETVDKGNHRYQSHISILIHRNSFFHPHSQFFGVLRRVFGEVTLGCRDFLECRFVGIQRI